MIVSSQRLDSGPFMDLQPAYCMFILSGAALPAHSAGVELCTQGLQLFTETVQ